MEKKSRVVGKNKKPFSIGRQKGRFFFINVKYLKQLKKINDSYKNLLKEVSYKVETKPTDKIRIIGRGGIPGIRPFLLQRHEGSWVCIDAEHLLQLQEISSTFKKLSKKESKKIEEEEKPPEEEKEEMAEKEEKVAEEPEERVEEEIPEEIPKEEPEEALKEEEEETTEEIVEEPKEEEIPIEEPEEEEKVPEEVEREKVEEEEIPEEKPKEELPEEEKPEEEAPKEFGGPEEEEKPEEVSEEEEVAEEPEEEPEGIPEEVEEPEVKEEKIEIPKKEKKPRNKYVYCIIPKKGNQNFEQIGFENREVYTIPFKSIRVVLSDSSLMVYKLTEDNIKIHESVVKEVMENNDAVVPMAFSMVFKNKKILKEILRKAYPDVKTALRLVKNKVELGVKVLVLDRTKFDADSFAEDIKKLKKIANAVKLGKKFSNNIILNVSYLVNKNKMKKFSTQIENLEKKHKGIKIHYTGPWPVYNFIDIKIGGNK